MKFTGKTFGKTRAFNIEIGWWSESSSSSWSFTKAEFSGDSNELELFKRGGFGLIACHITSPTRTINTEFTMKVY